MTTKEIDDLTPDNVAEGEEKEEESQPLSLEVAIESPTACERHVTVTISREDIERYFDKAFGEMMPNAAVPGFRMGRAPRKLVEQRFRKEVADQVKGSLLVDSLEQISEDRDFTAISEPEFDLDAVEVPYEGPMTFEFDIEVRPEFDLPNWKGLSVKRPIREFKSEDIDSQLEQMLERYGQLVPHEEAATLGDFVTVKMTCMCGDDQTSSADEITMRVRPALSFRDARCEEFGKLMDGVKAGEKRSCEVELSNNAPNTECRGKKLQIEFEVLEVKKMRLPELTEDFLEEMGGFETEGDLRDAIQSNLERQLNYEQGQKTRGQITAILTASADWELPPSMLERQSARELERAIMELRRSGFSEANIRAKENALRQNSQETTAAALKEHFILERIAEDQEIDAEDTDYDQEIALIAAQSGESQRRVRAQFEKRGLMDVLRNQIVERKVLALVEGEAKFEDTPFDMPSHDDEAVGFFVGGAAMATEVQKAGEDDEAADA